MLWISDPLYARLSSHVGPDLVARRGTKVTHYFPLAGVEIREFLHGDSVRLCISTEEPETKRHYNAGHWPKHWLLLESLVKLVPAWVIRKDGKTTVPLWFEILRG